jgi:hypothetical protein
MCSLPPSRRRCADALTKAAVDSMPLPERASRLASTEAGLELRTSMNGGLASTAPAQPPANACGTSAASQTAKLGRSACPGTDLMERAPERGGSISLSIQIQDVPGCLRRARIAAWPAPQPRSKQSPASGGLNPSTSARVAHVIPLPWGTAIPSTTLIGSEEAQPSAIVCLCDAPGVAVA